MAEGSIIIRVDAKQAQSSLDKLSTQLTDLDKKAANSQKTLDKLSNQLGQLTNVTKSIADSSKKTAEGIQAISVSSKASAKTLTSLNNEITGFASRMRSVRTSLLELTRGQSTYIKQMETLLDSTKQLASAFSGLQTHFTAQNNFYRRIVNSQRQLYAATNEVRGAISLLGGSLQQINTKLDGLNKLITIEEHLDKITKVVTKELNNFSTSMSKVASNSTKTVKAIRQLTQVVNTQGTAIQQNTKHSKIYLGYLVQLQTQANKTAQNILSAVRALNTFNTSARASNSNITRLSSSFRSLYTLTNGLNQVLFAAGTGLSITYAAGAIIEFEKALGSVKAITMSGSKQMEVFRDKAQELGATTIYTAGQVAEGMKFLAQAGLSTEEIMASITDILALAQSGNVDLATTAEIAAKALRGFNIPATEMARVADVMAQTATNSVTSIQELGYAYKYVAAVATTLNISIEETSAAIGTLSNAGMDSSIAGTALRGVLSDLANPTAKAAKIFQAFDLTLDDIDVKANGLIPVLHKLKQAGFSMTEVFAIFGQRAAPAFQILMQNLDGLEDLIEKNNDALGRNIQMQKDMDNNLYGDLKRLISAIEAFITVSFKETGALKTTRDALDIVSKGLKVLTDNIDRVRPILIGAFTGLVAKITLGRIAFGALATTAKTTMALMVANTTMAVANLGKLELAVLAVKDGFLLLWNVIKAHPFVAIATLAAGVYELFFNETKAEQKAREYGEALNKVKDYLKSTVQSVDVFKESLQGLDKEELKIKINLERESYYEVKAELENFATQPIKKEIEIDGNIEEVTVQFTDFDKKLRKLLKTAIETKMPLNQLTEEVKKLGVGIADLPIDKVVNDLSTFYRALELARSRVEAVSGAVRNLGSELAQTGAIAKSVDVKVEGAFNMVKAQETITKNARKIEELGIADKKTRAIYEKLSETLGGERVLSQALDINQLLKGKVVQNQDVIDTYNEAVESAALGIQNKLPVQAPLKPGQIASLQALADTTAKLYELQEADKAASKASSGGTKKTGGGASGVKKVENATLALQKLNEKMAVMEGTSNKMNQSLNNDLVQIDKLGKAAKLSGEQIQEFKDRYTAAFQTKVIREFTEAMLQATNQSVALEQIQLDKQLEEWQQKFIGAGLSVEETTEKVSALHEALNTNLLAQYYQDNAMWAEIFAGSQEILAMQTNLATRETDNQLLALEKLGVELSSVQKQMLQLYNQSKETKGAFSGIIDGFMEAYESATDLNKAVSELTNSALIDFSDTLSDAVITGKANFSDLANSIIQDIIRICMRLLIMKSIMAALNLLSPSVSVPNATGADVNNPANLSGGEWMKKGGAFVGGTLKAYRNTVVTQPTSFGYGSKKYGRGGIMGEAGPEAIMPLTRDKQGNLSVKADGMADVSQLTLSLVNLTNVMTRWTERDSSKATYSFADQQPEINIVINNNANAEVTTETSTNGNSTFNLEILIDKIVGKKLATPGTNSNKALRQSTGTTRQVVRRG